MVILETAAISAAGYGIYKGGDAAVRKGKQTHKEIKREQNRRTQRSELASKTKDRNERLARITDMRNGKAASTSWLPSLSSSREAATKTTPSTSTSTKSSDINDRYESVLKKLDEKPKKEKKGIMGMFGKKK
jgi:hypothetical protein